MSEPQAQPYRVAVLIGSLRKGSYNRQLALALQKIAPASLQLEIVEIGHLSFYNDDEADAPPAGYAEFRATIKAADAVLFLSPEYNRSIPAVLKNALDVGSRPYGHNAFNGKPGAVITLSPGALGGFGAHHHLRQVLVGMNVATLPTPEMYVGGANTLFTEDHGFTKPDTEKFMQGFLATFSDWIGRQKG
ncbi:NADPH-dependent FMN reductase [Roseateles terrae]|uniref:Chromate reductase n=1 Tax=Roseateles terrae TaxID=431060 RepID=A0ABR6GVJ0_9BURK|nr:NAD(P)H-dependent oxidoreductase [Roseateles terrae]MBB3196089.1 chromate reductase [Roseateles terrae]OWQ85442.1 ACP phosphodiesterase [Roseateles terrae]